MTPGLGTRNSVRRWSVFTLGAKALCLRELLPGEDVVQFGKIGCELYLIGQGELVVAVPDASGVERVVAQLGAGESFGEMALLRDEPRSATVRILTEARVWSLCAADYAVFIRETPSVLAAPEQVRNRRRLELRMA